MTPPFDLFDEAALLDRLTAGVREPWRPVVFLVGSPLTAPSAPGEPGVPGVEGMIERVRAALGRTDIPAPDAANPYQDAFEALQARRGPDAVHHVVRQAVLQASSGHPGELLDTALDRTPGTQRQACDDLEADLEGWHLRPGVEYLGRLAARYPQHFGRTVLTSNFDPLVEVSCRLAGRPCWRTTLHDDGRLQTGRSDVCHVVHVHGYWYDADTLHLPSQLQAPRPHLRASLRRLFEDVTLVVVAYGGWDDVFTRTLFEVVSDGGAFPEVIWTFYTGDEAAIRRGSAQLLDGLRPGLERGRVSFYGGIDCHAFLRALWDRLQETPLSEPAIVAPALARRPRRGAGPPAGRAAPYRSPFVVGSPIEHDEDLFGRWSQRDLLRDAIDRGQPVQVLGERRMGKTSMLRWVERHVSEWQERPAAWVNAQGLAGHSPEKLVLEVAWSLARLPEAEAALRRTGTGSQGAAEVLRSFLPLTLLVDEASALAEPGHGFDTDFLGALRAFGQERQLLWISTSHQDLQQLFRASGLTSTFLNDSRQVWVGQLEEEAARSLVARAGVEDAVEPVLEEAGGFAYGLQWLGDALARSPEDLETVRDAYAEAVGPVFRRWWDECGEDERTLLKRGLAEAPLRGLADRSRRLARRLVLLGFLLEHEEGFVLPGAAWRAFVEEV